MVVRETSDVTSRPAPSARTSPSPDFASLDLAIGDRLVVGDVVLELDGAPHSLRNARAADGGSRVRQGVSARGAARLLLSSHRGGEVSAGLPVTHQPYAGTRVGLVGMFRDWFVRKTLDEGRLRETLAAPIAARARKDWEDLLPHSSVRAEKCSLARA